MIYQCVYSAHTGGGFARWVCCFLLQERNFYFVALDDYEDKENWFGAGKFEFDKTNKAYLIADTDAV